MKHFFAILCICLFIALTIGACSKFDSDNKNQNFDVTLAKGWFDNIYKNSTDWFFLYKREPGIVSLNWDSTKYQKIGNLEIIEVPITKPTRITLVKKSGYTQADMVLNSKQQPHK